MTNRAPFSAEAIITASVAGITLASALGGWGIVGVCALGAIWAAVSWACPGGGNHE